MNSDISKASDPHRLLLNISDKINLKRSDKYVVLSNLSNYNTWKNIKKSRKNNKFKISSQTWNEEFELPDGPYSVSDFQDYFKYIFKKHEAVTDNPSIMIYVNKTGYYLELLTHETMTFFEGIKSKITKDENSENLLYLEITEVLLIHCSIVQNNCQPGSRVLYKFVPNK